jgi:hypothetical protein
MQQNSPGAQQQQQQQPQEDSKPPPPLVQQLFKGQLQGMPLVTAARLRMIPIQPVPLRGLQVGGQYGSACHVMFGNSPCGTASTGHDVYALSAELLVHN